MESRTCDIAVSLSQLMSTNKPSLVTNKEIFDYRMSTISLTKVVKSMMILNDTITNEIISLAGITFYFALLLLKYF